MLSDVKTGFTIWKNTTKLKYVAAKILLFFSAGCIAVNYIAPRLFEQVNEISAVLSLNGDLMIILFALLYITSFHIILKQIVDEAYEKNRDLLYQLAVSKRSGYICTMLHQINWYCYTLVVLLAICSNRVVPACLLIPAYTALFIIVFGIYYGLAASGFYPKYKKPFPEWLGPKKNRKKDILKSRPELELFKITVFGLYRCRNLVIIKMILIIFILYCGNTHMLHGSIFFLAEALLILCNDRYWRYESDSLPYFSEIGIPVSKYLCTQFIAGIWFNIALPLLIFYHMTNKTESTAVGLALLSYLLIFWYLTQIYLYFIIGRDKDSVILLYDMVFLILALLPPAGLIAMFWLYKTITHKWRNE